MFTWIDESKRKRISHIYSAIGGYKLLRSQPPISLDYFISSLNKKKQKKRKKFYIFLVNEIQKRAEKRKSESEIKKLWIFFPHLIHENVPMIFRLIFVNLFFFFFAIIPLLFTFHFINIVDLTIFWNNTFITLAIREEKIKYLKYFLIKKECGFNRNEVYSRNLTILLNENVV